MSDCERKINNLHVKFVSKFRHKSGHNSGFDLNFGNYQTRSRAQKCAAQLKRVNNALKPISRWIIASKVIEFTRFTFYSSLLLCVAAILI